MRVELLWCDGCPSHPEALERLQEVLRDEGLDPASVDLVEITSDDQAARERFFGSPTIRMDGDDAIPPAEGDPIGLSCRVYRLRDGRPSPLPDVEDLRDAVRRHAYAAG
jgi:hypothetical protein